MSGTRICDLCRKPAGDSALRIITLDICQRCQKEHCIGDLVPLVTDLQEAARERGLQRRTDFIAEDATRSSQGFRYEVCAACRRTTAVRRDGTFWMHKAADGTHCPAGNKPPAEVQAAAAPT